MQLNFILISFLGLGGSEILIILFLLIPLCILPVIFYLLTLQNTLKQVRPENRRMSPGEVWLSLIPLFGTVWQFIVINRIADSLKAEFAKRNIHTTEDRPGVSIGLTYCILNCCGIIPYLGILTSIAGFICWLIYWVKINNYKNKLQYNQNVNININPLT